jgi:hypothetical protein
VRRNRTLKYVKVLWSQQTKREATWESHMREKYLELFMTGIDMIMFICVMFNFTSSKTRKNSGTNSI